MNNSISSAIEVSVNLETAFKVFTEELNSWWLRGPINFHDSARALGHHMECHDGGRIIEVYDANTGEGLHLATISEWTPPNSLAWKSEIDDVQTQVKFEAMNRDKTIVTVTATIPDGGSDFGGTSWVRVTEAWLPMWCEERAAPDAAPNKMARLAVGIYYQQPVRAATWLRDAFQLKPAGPIPAEEKGEPTWIEFHVGDVSLMIFNKSGASSATDPQPSHVPWIFVEDLEAHLAHARRHDVEITSEIATHGATTYEARDIEGNAWTFAQASAYTR